MWILLLFLTLLTSVLFLLERSKNRTTSRELQYIREWIATIPDNRNNGYVLIPSDNRETRELAAELNRFLDKFYSQKTEYQNSKRAMLQVLTNISHDLRTPLTVLRGYSEILNHWIAETPAAEDIRETAAKIDSKANELTETINEYFTLSKITSGDMKLELQRTNVTELCHEIILDYYDILEQNQYQVEIEMNPSPLYATVDVDALKRILKNLVDNAIKHGCDGKYLALRLKESEGEIAIEVEDHGKGISPKDQERIFYRNFTTAHKGSGNGLGLTIAKNLAQQMNAVIQLTSEPGSKTVFTLLLKS